MCLKKEAGVGRGVLAEQSRVASSRFLLGLNLRDLPLYYCQLIPDASQFPFQGAGVLPLSASATRFSSSLEAYRNRCGRAHMRGKHRCWLGPA